MSSTPEIAFELISYALWVSIISTNSWTTFTLELSSAPCTNLPNPLANGFSTIGGPLAGVSISKFWPIGCNPVGFAKSANWSCPTSSASTWPGTWTETIPSEDILIEVTPSGIYISGCKT